MSEIERDVQAFRSDFARLQQEIGKVIVGQQEVVEQTLIALIAGGHVLLEGVPGLGKTLLVKTIADAVSLTFSRSLAGGQTIGIVLMCMSPRCATVVPTMALLNS